MLETLAEFVYSGVALGCLGAEFRQIGYSYDPVNDELRAERKEYLVLATIEANREWASNSNRKSHVARAMDKWDKKNNYSPQFDASRKHVYTRAFGMAAFWLVAYPYRLCLVSGKKKRSKELALQAAAADALRTLARHEPDELLREAYLSGDPEKVQSTLFDKSMREIEARDKANPLSLADYKH